MTELSHDEDGFHEIQLSGKQLVFLFMATTVVSVVIFLCGVLVGRGVRGDTVSAAETTIASAPASDADAGGAAMPPATTCRRCIVFVPSPRSCPLIKSLMNPTSSCAAPTPRADSVDASPVPSRELPAGMAIP